jgi:hypothetical protein
LQLLQHVSYKLGVGFDGQILVGAFVSLADFNNHDHVIVDTIDYSHVVFLDSQERGIAGHLIIPGWPRVILEGTNESPCDVAFVFFEFLEASFGRFEDSELVRQDESPSVHFVQFFFKVFPGSDLSGLVGFLQGLQRG